MMIDEILRLTSVKGSSCKSQEGRGGDAKICQIRPLLHLTALVSGTFDAVSGNRLRKPRQNFRCKDLYNG
jgi:hypothetical protein